MTMYKVSFYIGVGLICLAVVLAFVQGKNLLAITFGGLGIGNTITFFLARPAKKLQESRSRLAQLQAALFTWFIDIYNWNSYLILLDRTGQATFQNLKQVSDTTMEHTRQIIDLIGKHIEPEDKLKASSR